VPPTAREENGSTPRPRRGRRRTRSASCAPGACPAPPHHTGIQGPGSWASPCRICPRVTGPWVPRRLGLAARRAGRRSPPIPGLPTVLPRPARVDHRSSAAPSAHHRDRDLISAERPGDSRPAGRSGLADQGRGQQSVSRKGPCAGCRRRRPVRRRKDLRSGGIRRGHQGRWPT
jgi:hypothetical protein